MPTRPLRMPLTAAEWRSCCSRSAPWRTTALLLHITNCSRMWSQFLKYAHSIATDVKQHTTASRIQSKTTSVEGRIATTIRSVWWSVPFGTKQEQAGAPSPPRPSRLYVLSMRRRTTQHCHVSPRKEVLAWRYGSVHRNYAHDLAGVGRSNGESRTAIEAKPAGTVTV